LTVSERARLLEQERELRELRMENEFLKKARSALRPGSPVVEKYEFIDSCPDDDAKYAYPVKKMCAWLSVSSSGFFDWQKRPQSATTARRERLALLIAAEFADSDETYGYRRIHARLARSGVHCGPNWSATSCATWAYVPASRGRGGPA
jgi:putative transposase